MAHYAREEGEGEEEEEEERRECCKLHVVPNICT